VKKNTKLKILITAGPTREMLDPVRFLSNVSTGEMGYALARESFAKGHSVTLVSGPTSLTAPAGVRYIPIVSAAELKKTCETLFPKHDVLVMVAAVCDFTPMKTGKQKIRRTRTKKLYLQQTPDIVSGLAARKEDRIVIGFCLETENWLRNAKAKLDRKNLDGIVANYYTPRHIPFGNRRINTAFLSPGGKMVQHKSKTKPQIASDLLKWIVDLNKKVVS